MLWAGISVAGFLARAQALYFKGDGSAFNTSNAWSTINGGPYNSSFSGGTAYFSVVNSTAAGNGNLNDVAGIVVEENITIGSGAGTLSNRSSGVIEVNVSAGKTANFGTSFNLDSSATAGYIKSGEGVWATQGATYGGGFTLNAGTMILRSANGMGANASTNTLTIAGGVIGAAQTYDLSSKFGGGIYINGDFGLGSAASSADLAAGLTFSNATHLGSVTRTISIGGSGTYRFAGAIDGTGGFTVNGAGAGKIVLSGANTYEGATTVSSGILNIQSAAALGLITSGTTVSNGGSLQLEGGFTSAAEPLVLNGTGNSNAGALRNISGANTYTGTISLGSSSRINADLGSLSLTNTVTGSGLTLTVGGAANTTISNDVALGSGNLYKDGAGTLTLSGISTYTGETTIAGGTLKLLSVSGSPISSSVLSFADTGTFLYDNTNAVGGASTESFGTLTFSRGEGVVQTSRVAAQNVSLTFSSASARAAGATGTFSVVGGTNGATNSIVLSSLAAGFVDQGTFFNTGGAGTYAWLNSAGGYVRGINYGTDAGTAVVNGTSAKKLVTGSTFYKVGAAIAASDQTASATVNTVEIAGAFNITLGAAVTIGLTNGGLLKSGNSAATISGGTSLQPGNNVELVIRADQASDALTISTPIVANGTNALTKTGPGSVTLNAANTHTGSNYLNQGTLIIANANALGPTGGTAGTFVINGGTLNTGASAITIASNNAQQWNGDFAFTGANALNLGSGAVSLGGSRSIAVNGSTLTVGGAIGGVGYGLTKTGTGTLVFSGANTYTGATAINDGALTLSGGNALADTSAVTLQNVAAAVLNVTASETIGSLAGGGTTGGNVTLSNSSTLTVGADGATTTYAGIITGAGGLTKTGSGALTLNPRTTNPLTSYSGQTTISGGTLNLFGGAAIPDASAVVLANTAGANLIVSTAETIGSLAGGGATGGNVLLNATLTTGGDNSSTVFGGVISGTSGLIKNGSGTLTLSGANTFGGVLQISGGVVNVQNSGGLGSPAGRTNVQIAGSTALELQGGIAIGAESLTLQGAGISSGGALRNISGNNSFAGVITLSGAARINSDSGTLSLSNAIGGADVSLTLGGAGNIESSGAVGLGAGALIKDGAGTLTLTGANTYTGDTTISHGTLQAENIVVGGGSSNLGDASSVVVLGDGTNAGTLAYTGPTANYTRGFTVSAGGGRVDNTGSGTLTIETGGIAAAGAFTVGGSANTNLSSVISGAGRIVKTGSGILTLSGVNTFTGTTTINEGTLAVTGLGNVGVSSTLGAPALGNATIKIGNSATGGTLSFLGSAPASTNRVIDLAGTTGGATLDASGTGSNTVTFSGGVTATGAGSKTLILAGTNTSTNTLSGVIADNSPVNTTSVTKMGSGKWVLSGANTYTGATTIAEGTLQAATIVVSSGSSNLGNAATAVTLGGAATAGTLSYTGSAATYTRGFDVIAGGGGFDNVGGTLTIATGDISAAGPFTVGGSSNTDISAVVSGAGSLVKTGAGTVTLSGANTYTGSTTVAQGTLQAASIVVSSGSSHLGNASDAIILGDGVNTGTLSYTGSTVSYTRGFTVNAGGGRVDNAGSGTLTLETGGIATAGAFTVGGSANTAISAVISGAGSLVKQGSGAVTLSGANTYTGATTINAGVLNISGGSAINNAGAMVLADAASARLNLDDSETIGSLEGGGSTGGVVTLNSNTLTTGGNGNSTTFAGVISGTGGVSKAGSGTWSLTGANTYSGTTTINSGGDVTVATTGGLGSGPLVVNGSLNLNNAIQSVSALSGSGVITFGSGHALTITQATDSAYSGQLNSAGAITKAGAGALTLSGANDFSGGTTIGAGALVTGSATALGTGDVTVNGGNLSTASALQIGGNLTLAGGSISLNGTSAGSITLGTGMNFSMTGGALNLTLGGSFDQIVGSGSGIFTLSGGTLSFDTGVEGFSYATSYQVLNGFASGSISNVTLSGYDSGSYTASLANTGLLTFTAIAIPEPSTYAMLGGAFVLFAAYLRRRFPRRSNAYAAVVPHHSTADRVN